MVLQHSRRNWGCLYLPHKTLNSCASFGFCTWYFMANKVPGFEINTSCIKSTYKAKVRSKSYRMRGMTEYQEDEKEVERKAMREASRTGAALVSESGAGAAEEHPIRRTRHVMPKRLEPLLPKVNPA